MIGRAFVGQFPANVILNFGEVVGRTVTRSNPDEKEGKCCATT